MFLSTKQSYTKVHSNGSSGGGAHSPSITLATPFGNVVLSLTACQEYLI